jgi:hypothetical protein
LKPKIDTDSLVLSLSMGIKPLRFNLQTLALLNSTR